MATSPQMNVICRDRSHQPCRRRPTEQADDLHPHGQRAVAQPDLLHVRVGSEPVGGGEHQAQHGADCHLMRAQCTLSGRRAGGGGGRNLRDGVVPLQCPPEGAASARRTSASAVSAVADTRRSLAHSSTRKRCAGCGVRARSRATGAPRGREEGERGEAGHARLVRVGFGGDVQRNLPEEAAHVVEERLRVAARHACAPQRERGPCQRACVNHACSVRALLGSAGPDTTEREPRADQTQGHAQGGEAVHRAQGTAKEHVGPMGLTECTQVERRVVIARRSADFNASGTIATSWKGGSREVGARWAGAASTLRALALVRQTGLARYIRVRARLSEDLLQELRHQRVHHATDDKRHLQDGQGVREHG
jgi:hypothetical protein